MLNIKISVTKIAVIGLCLLPAAVLAQSPSAPLRYHFTLGQKLRYLIMRDPYFNNPTGAIETTNPDAPYRPPVVQRLTELVQSVQPDGAAILKVTVESEPGFEDDSRPVTQTLTVTPGGQIVSPVAPSDFLRAFFRLRPAVQGPGDLAIVTQTLPPAITRRTSPDHDGTLLQTTSSRQSDRLVFDVGAGNLLRQTSTLTIVVSLVMTNRGARGVADFGRVIPNVEVTQTMTIERKAD